MKTARWGLLIGALILWGCGGSRSATAVNDTYLTAKDRARLNQERSRPSPSSDDREIDAREDNYDRPSRDWDDDYSYARRARRYSSGIWYDPWCDPWWGPSWGWRRSMWWGPSWGWGAGWGDPWWGWGPAVGWYYTPGWGWTYYSGYWGPTFYAGPGGGWANPSPNRPSRSYNYTPRTYTTPSGTTTYTAPRRSPGVISSGGGSMRSASPSYSPSSESPRMYSPRPSMSGGVTSPSGGGGVRSSGGMVRPR
ncbi:MAG: hypothetical protein NZ580_01340 [Bacteroidia bacterium]|nr:hypothetical protein [Bacteroidia bacterium]